jgi:hypothetical protein
MYGSAPEPGVQPGVGSEGEAAAVAEDPEGDAEMEEAAAGDAAGAAEDSDRTELFWYMDAYENPEGRPGEVFLFGKVLAPEVRPCGHAGRLWAARAMIS